MGSYATLYYTEHGQSCVASVFSHKFFGYITDDECLSTETYKYLNGLCDIDVSYLNDTYIGGVCLLSKEEAENFMALYAKDYCEYYGNDLKETNQDWIGTLGNLPNNLKFRLSFG